MEEDQIVQGAINIQFWGKASEAGNTTNAESFFQYLLNYAFQYVPFQNGTLELIIIAQPEELKDAIYWAQDRAGAIRGFSSEGAGEDAFHQTGAKTIPRLSSDGTVISSIVFNAGILYLISAEMSKNLPSLHDWDQSAQFFLYAVVHELGHVYDSYCRGDLGSKVDYVNETDWKVLAKHCSGVLVGEFLACYYAAPAVAPELQERMIDSWYDEVAFYLSDLVRRRDNFVHSAEQAAVHSLWLIMSQFGKLIGHQANNSNLPPFSMIEDAEDDEKRIFSDIEAILLNEIPQRRKDSSLEDYACERLTPLWLRLANIYGFNFETD